MIKNIGITTLFIFITLFTCSKAWANKGKHLALVDSVQLHINNTTKKDTHLVNSYVLLSHLLRKTKEYNESNKMLQKGANIEKELGNFDRQYDLLIEIARSIGYQQKNWEEAYIHFERTAKEAKAKGLKYQEATCYRYMSYADWLYLGNLDKAIDYSLKASVLFRETQSYSNLAGSYNLMGLVYELMEEYDQTIVYYKKAIHIHDSIGNPSGKAKVLYNISLIYMAQNKFDLASESLKKCYKLYQELDHKSAFPMVLMGMGELKIKEGKYEVAITTFKQALEMPSSSDNWTMAGIHVGMGEAYYELKQYNKAQRAAVIGLEHSIQGNLISLERVANKMLAKIYAKQGNYAKAYKHHTRFFAINDSLVGKERTDKIAELENRFENRQKELTIENLEKEKKLQTIELKVSNEQKEKQKIISYSIGLGLFLLLLMTFFIFSRLRITRKQKVEIELKNQEITDSINYAKRIQTAILPPDKVVKQYLKESFILYKPKDIVAGDFYWLEYLENKVLFAAADCTGHGVPGAMVSVVCNNALNRSVREHGLSDPGEILTKTREIVIAEFEKSDEEVKDGMDIALCSLEGNTLQYAGANNPLWIIRNGEILETKANKQPIGKFDNPLPYTTHTFELKKGDNIYIFSDGYVDQFGGEQGKKFKAKAFRELLLFIQDKTMEEQKNIVDNAFESWKGSLEQIDDVCVVGVRV